jgi:hypothetical protein
MLITQLKVLSINREVKPIHTATKPKSYLAVIDELFEARFTCSRVRKMPHDVALHDLAIAQLVIGFAALALDRDGTKCTVQKGSSRSKNRL